jgi:hypothetical protein
MKSVTTLPSAEMLAAENKIAVMLSIVPGLGHIYKGHTAAGLFWMLIGMPLATWVGILMGLATAGIGLLLPIACWVALAVDAYYERDLRGKRHWLPRSVAPDDGEDVVD